MVKPKLKSFHFISPVVLRSSFDVIFQVLFTAQVSLRGRAKARTTIETKTGGRRQKMRGERKKTQGWKTLCAKQRTKSGLICF